MTNKRGQSAMEYLMTYGWAILVIIIVIAVLFYMGVLNPKSTQTSTCTFAPGVSCYSFKLANGSGGLALDFGQAIGKSVTITGISCSQNDSVALNPLPLGNEIVIPSGEHRWITGGNSLNQLNCTDEQGRNLTWDDAQLGERYKGKVCVSYIEMDTNTARTVCGDISAKFEVGTSGGTDGGTPTVTPTATATETPTPTPTETPSSTPSCSGTCGDGVCNGCGATISDGSWVLQDDLLCGECDGIVISGNDVVLDCQGHSITSFGDPYQVYRGIFLNSATGARVQHCVVSGFNVGAYVEFGSGNTLTENTFSSNQGALIGAGISTYVTNGGTFTHNIVNSNRNGIVIGGGGGGNTIAYNTVSLNIENGIYLGSGSNNNLQNNAAGGNSGYDFYCGTPESNNDLGGNTCETQQGCGSDGAGWLTSCPVLAWSQVFDPPGDPYAMSLGTYGGALYAGVGDGVGKAYKFDGSEWSQAHTMSGGWGVSWFEEYGGALYLGGSGTGEVDKFDGASWSQVCSLPEESKDAEVYNGFLYITDWDGIVYRFDGATCTPVFNSGQDEVWALAVHNGALYMGSGDNRKMYIFDGSTWEELTAFPAGGRVMALKSYNGALYAGGDGGAELYRLDGSAWSPVCALTGSEIRSFVEYNGLLYIGVDGSGKIYWSDGSTCTEEYATGESDVYSLAAYGTTIYASGGYSRGAIYRKN